MADVAGPASAGLAAARPAARRAVLGHAAAVWAVRLAAVVAIAVAWELIGRRDSLFVAPFTTTVRHLVDLWRDGQMGHAMWRSNQALLIGFPAAVAAGLPIGFALGRVRLADRAFGYFLDMMLVVPMIAAVPVIIVALGLTLTARVVVVIVFALPFVALYARAAVRVVEHHLVEMAAAFGASRRQTWQTVIVPSAFAPVFTGLRVGLAHGISGMIVIELTLIPAGLGGLIVNFRSSFATGDLYGVTLMILLEGFVLVGAARMLERWVARRLGKTDV
ncbi:MAG TPA: ABC transporter permease subunit [Gaiellaceae bacterium]|nr:ABC transporter permease subunit [Gaiellaceae bacterium]